jgi:hypothetical protein
MNPRRITRSAIIIKPSTLLRFHAALRKRKYQQLYSPSGGRKPGPKGPSWLTVIGHVKDSLWSVDLFRNESILLKSHWVMVVMDQYTRRIIGFAVHAGNVDGPTLCRMFNDATSRQNISAQTMTLCFNTIDGKPIYVYLKSKRSNQQTKKLSTSMNIDGRSTAVDCLNFRWLLN